ncbi:hypothetical protein NEAUS06_1015 [Nematocida ausubeli]|nr:hypothetical protein NEAUS06_0866 [Nematocida ausubeli]KAI5134266.1 hypothetical protein NEAUS06_1015 [Nematocida ausubeli]
MISRIVLKLMMLQSILARVNMEEIKTVSETFIGEKQDVIINPMGPLNLQRGYIVHQGGYMHNKRFYSHEIDTDYGLYKNGLSNENKQEYNFVRTPVNDKVYECLNKTTPKGKYMSTYHEMLIKMFPSMDENLSIEIDRSNAFTNFLRVEHVKKDTKYILAALLLLSEGVDVKIAVESTKEKKKLVIKSKKYEEKVFVDVVMHTAGIDPVTNEHSDSIYQSEAAEIVDFYMQCRDNPLLKKGGKFAMPTTKKEFESGKFLNNAAFLIQTYIYEFIDTAESYKDFVNAVHELLVDQVAEKENLANTKKKSKEGKIFDELFIAKEALSENKKYIESFCDFVQATNESIKLPFGSDSQLPRYTRVPQCKLDKTGFELDQSLYYSDCVESALLGLFSCLAYSQKTRKYKTSHMGEGISKELKNFFKKYPRPAEIIDSKMHKEWSRVVACLDNDKIDYKQNKNELLPGVGNIFLAISEITGQKEEILELVEYIESICKKGELDDDMKWEIEVKIKSIIKSLLPSKNVEVGCEQARLGTRSNGKADIFAKIFIIHNINNEPTGFTLNITPGYANISLFSTSEDNFDSIKEGCEEISKIYSNVNCYMGHLMIHYVSIELESSVCDNVEFFNITKEIIRYTMHEEPEKISKTFLLGRVFFSLAKLDTIRFFMEKMIKKGKRPAESAIRFTGNVLGSLQLNDNTMLWGVLMRFPSDANMQEYYPRIASEELGNL